MNLDAVSHRAFRRIEVRQTVAIADASRVHDKLALIADDDELISDVYSVGLA